MANWCFAPKNEDVSICKPWLTFSPMEGVMAPEETMEVEVLVTLNLEEAYTIATTKPDVRNV
jgi:hypothetical protein